MCQAVSWIGFDPDLSVEDLIPGIEAALQSESYRAAMQIREHLRLETEDMCVKSPLKRSLTKIQAGPRLEPGQSPERRDGHLSQELDLPSACPSEDSNCVFDCLSAGFTAQVRWQCQHGNCSGLVT